jgi:hypothetical protein
MSEIAYYRVNPKNGRAYWCPKTGSKTEQKSTQSRIASDFCLNRRKD